MRFTFELPENMNSKLSKISEKTGLNKSEICRRGLLNEMSKIEEAV